MFEYLNRLLNNFIIFILVFFGTIVIFAIISDMIEKNNNNYIQIRMEENEK